MVPGRIKPNGLCHFYTPTTQTFLDVSQTSSDAVWTNNRKILAANNVFNTDAGAGSTYTQQVYKTLIITAASTTLTGTSVTSQMASADASPMYVLLPAAASNTDKRFQIKKIDTLSQTVYIAPNGSDTFDGSAAWLTLSSSNNWHVIQSDGTANWKIVGQTAAVGSFAPVDATYVTMSSNSTLTAERVATAGKNVFLTDGGANSTVTVEVGPVTNITGNTTVTATSNTIYTVDASGGAVAFTLPAASNSNKAYEVKKTDSSSNAVTITRAGSDTIDGATTFVLTIQYQAAKIVAGTVANQWNVF